MYIFIGLLRSNTRLVGLDNTRLVSWLVYAVLVTRSTVCWSGSVQRLWHSPCIPAPLIIISKQLNTAWNSWVVLYWDMLPFDHCLDSCCVCCLSVTHFARSDLSLLPSCTTRSAAVTVVGLKLCRDILWIWRDLRNGPKFSDVGIHKGFVLFWINLDLEKVGERKYLI